MNGLASRLMILRGLAGAISQRDFAKLASISPGYPGIIERATKEPELSGHMASRMARVFGCTLEYLINGEGEPPSEAEVCAAVARARVALATEEEKAAS